MAYPYDDEQDPYVAPPPVVAPRPTNPNPPSSGGFKWTAQQNHETQTTDPTQPNFNPRDRNIENAAGNWYDYLKDQAGQFESEFGWNPYDDSDLMGVIQNMSYEGNQYTDHQLLANVLDNWKKRNNNVPGPSDEEEAASARMGGSGDWISDFLKRASSGTNPMKDRVQSEIIGLLDRGGAYNEGITRRRRENARLGIDSARQSQTNQARANLADRGLLSLPGVASGAEAGSVANIEQLLAPIYASEMRNIEADELGNADRRFMQALGLGESSGQSQFENALAAAMGANTRQRTLSDIALGTLDRSISWQSLLAQLGMKQDTFDDGLIEAILTGAG